MSPAMSALASVGVTHNMLILAVLAIIGAGIIGLYWHIIVPGAIVVLVGSLFINFSPIEFKTESAKEEIKEETLEDYANYMKDCTEVADYSRKHCENLWHGRQVEEKELEKLPEVKTTETHVDFKPVSEVKLIEVDNVEYKARRAEALKKPNAVVLQATYR
jgi:hypothetical protein